MAQHSATEQYLLELINRARLDPQAEAARYDVNLGSISAAAKQPLAGNDDIAQAAEGHSAWMLATNTFSHTGSGGSSAGDRMESAGYDFTGSWTWGENISWRGTTGSINLKSFVDAQHAGLFRSDGHRANILSQTFREAGVGIETGKFGGYNAAMTTEDFAKSGNAVFLTGVAFTDGDGDNFYTPGEGLGGVSIHLTSSSGTQQSITTSAAGGYVAKTVAGETYAISLSGVNVTLTMPDGNAKLDLIGSGSVASSTSVKLGAGTVNAKLLGVADLDATGNTLANTIVGNKGSNEISGGAGADTMSGGGGNDTFTLAEGETDGDEITDFSANDFLRFEGFGSDASLTSLGGNLWQVSDGVHSEQLTISGTVASGNHGFFDSVDTGPTPPSSPPDSPSDPDPLPETPPETPPAPTTNPNRIDGTPIRDYLKGTSGDDSIRGGGGADTLVGGDGDDTLKGGNGPDILMGNKGADVLIMDGGDTARGGYGADTFEVTLTPSPAPGDSVLIQGFSLSEDRVVLSLPSSFAISSAIYRRGAFNGDGKWNDIILQIEDVDGESASLYFENRYGALRNNAGLSHADFAGDGMAELPGDFADFVETHEWIQFG